MPAGSIVPQLGRHGVFLRLVVVLLSYRGCCRSTRATRESKFAHGIRYGYSGRIPHSCNKCDSGTPRSAGPIYAVLHWMADVVAGRRGKSDELHKSGLRSEEYRNRINYM